MFCFLSWAVFVAAAMRLIGLFNSPENQLRLAVALAGAAIALYAIARAGTWPRTLYMLSIGYLAYFAAGGGWHGLWQVAAVPAESIAETLALTLELAGRVVLKDLESERHVRALAQAYDLVVMPITQLVLMIYFARALMRKR